MILISKGPLSPGMLAPVTMTPVGGSGDVETCNDIIIDAYGVIPTTPVGSIVTCDADCTSSAINPFSVFPASPTGFECFPDTSQRTMYGNAAMSLSAAAYNNLAYIESNKPNQGTTISISGKSTFGITPAALKFVRDINKSACTNGPINPFSLVKQSPVGYRCKSEARDIRAQGNGSLTISQSAIDNISNIANNPPQFSGAGAGGSLGAHPYPYGTGYFALTQSAYDLIVYVNSQPPPNIIGGGTSGVPGYHTYPSGNGSFKLNDVNYINWVNDPANRPNISRIQGNCTVTVSHDSHGGNPSDIIPIFNKISRFIEYRTPSVEEIIASTSSYDVVSGNDLKTIAGSYIVESVSIDFSLLNIVSGNSIVIDEVGFDSYTIASISGTKLTLNKPMPATITDGKFTVNQMDIAVKTAVTAFPRIAVKSAGFKFQDHDLNLIANNKVQSPNNDFTAIGILPNDIIMMFISGKETYAKVISVDGNYLYLDRNFNVGFAGAQYGIYTSENELPGPKAMLPAYDVIFQNEHQVLRIKDGVKQNDLIIVQSLGKNHEKVRGKHAVWSNRIENSFKTTLPQPISVEQVRLTKVILEPTQMNVINCSLSGDQKTATCVLTTFNQPSSKDGRFIKVTIAGINVDYNYPCTAFIEGTLLGNNTSELIRFTDQGSVITTNVFSTITKVTAVFNPFTTLARFAAIEIEEANPMTVPDVDDVAHPVILHTFQIDFDKGMKTTGADKLTVVGKVFSHKLIGYQIRIEKPMVSWYKISDVDGDTLTVTLMDGSPANLSPMANSNYTIYTDPTKDGGYQNGYFFLKSSKYL